MRIFSFSVCQLFYRPLRLLAPWDKYFCLTKSYFPLTIQRGEGSSAGSVRHTPNSLLYLKGKSGRGRPPLKLAQQIPWCSDLFFHQGSVSEFLGEFVSESFKSKMKTFAQRIIQKKSHLIRISKQGGLKKHLGKI